MAITELEIIGLQLVALMRDGQLSSFKCETCTDEMQELRNCKLDDRDDPVYAHPLVGELFACPMRMVSNSVLGFIDRMDYLEKYPSSAPDYDDVNPRFWEAVKQYESIRNELRDTDNSKPSSDENLSKMASLFKKKDE